MILYKLFITFFKIGLFTFGGGYAMLPLIEEEVIKNSWLTIEELVNFIAVSESTPGPFAVNVSTYIGMVKGGILGSFFATLGVILPSFIIILLVAKFYEKFKNSKIIKGIMSGLKPAVVGLIGSSLVSVGKTVFISDNKLTFIISFTIFTLMSYLSFKKVHPIIIICLSAIIGIITGYVFNII